MGTVGGAMMVTLVVALAVLLIVYSILATRASKQMKQVKKERDMLFRTCFLNGLAGILAHIANADGTVTNEEELVATKLFSDMSLDEDDYQLCLELFKKARESGHPLKYYTNLFVPYSTKESRIIIYEVLWDVVAADGKLDVNENTLLKELLMLLKLDYVQYEYNMKRQSGKFTEVEGAIKAAAKKLGKVL